MSPLENIDLLIGEEFVYAMNRLLLLNLVFGVESLSGNKMVERVCISFALPGSSRILFLVGL